MINTSFNRDEEISKNIQAFFINNNSQNINSKTYFKEEIPQYSILKHIYLIMMICLLLMIINRPYEFSKILLYKKVKSNKYKKKDKNIYNKKY